jgi:glycosyltransferase involved in cell wall biosynthesis
MLFFVRESFPTFRPDVQTLFGEVLSSRGHQIDLVMQASDEAEASGPRLWNGTTVWLGRTDARGGFIHRLHRQWLAFWHDYAVLRGSWGRPYQAVQVRDKFLIGAIAALIARRHKRKFFYWLSFPEPESQFARVRGGTARYPVLNLIRGAAFWFLLYRIILPRCDHAFVQSEQMRRDLIARGAAASKLTAVPMGVALTDVRSSSAAKPANNIAITVAYLGTLDPQRRLEMLVEMLALLRASSLNFRLLLIGGDDPEDRARLEQVAARLHVSSSVEITGMLPRAAALHRLQEADICLSPFFPTPILRSTSPTKLVEYLAFGLPVVANNHPEQQQVLRESGAGVCVPWGARFFARGVLWLAKAGPEVRQRMGDCGRHWVLENRTYDTLATRLEAKYHDLLSV